MEKFKSLPAATRSTIITYAMVVIAFLIMQGLLSVGAVSNSTQGLLVPICAYICMAISLNLVVGISGELSLGHAGFMSVGAFTGVVVSTALAGSGTSGPVRLLVAIVAAGVSAAIAGLLIGIPVMRLRGDYLAIVTLAFGEIIKNLLNNLYVGLDVRGLHFSMSDAASLGMAEGGKVVINGPRFSTKAESRYFGMIGGDLVNMTQYPEAYLCQEKNIPLVNIALVTDYDAGLKDNPDIPPVTNEMVVQVLNENTEEMKTLIFRLIARIGSEA